MTAFRLVGFRGKYAVVWYEGKRRHRRSLGVPTGVENRAEADRRLARFIAERDAIKSLDERPASAPIVSRKRQAIERRPVVYFVTYAERDDAPIKIGHTTGNPKARLSELQVGNPEPLKIFATIKGGEETESVLHKLFADDCISGEWHRRSERLIGAIEALKAAA